MDPTLEELVDYQKNLTQDFRGYVTRFDERCQAHLAELFRPGDGLEEEEEEE